MAQTAKKAAGSGTRSARSIQQNVKNVEPSGPPRSTETVAWDGHGRARRRIRKLVRFRLMKPLEGGDPMLGIVRRASLRGLPKQNSEARSKIKSAGVAGSIRAGTRRRAKGRWPVDLVRECSGNGLLAMRVWPSAGLERYGLSDDDMIFIGLDDPDEGGPVLAGIDDILVAGWYRPRRGGRVTIVPFVKGTEVVRARSDQFKVFCSLKCICTLETCR